MKVAIVTVDKKTVSQHFGRSPFYAIYSIEDGKVIGTEFRERKTGHFAQNQQHTHDHDHDNPKGHGFGAEHDNKHDEMAMEISDCQILIAGGMGRGAYERFFSNGINVIMTDMNGLDETIDAYIKGELKNLYIERTH